MNFDLVGSWKLYKWFTCFSILTVSNMKSIPSKLIDVEMILFVTLVHYCGGRFFIDEALEESCEHNVIRTNCLNIL